MSSNIDLVIAELKIASIESDVSREGFEDYKNMDVEQPTKDLATAMNMKWDKRLHLVNNAIKALDALLNDGYPLPIEAETSPSIAADLDAQIASLQSARSRIKVTGPVVDGHYEFDDTVPGVHENGKLTS